MPTIDIFYELDKEYEIRAIYYENGEADFRLSESETQDDFYKIIEDYYKEEFDNNKSIMKRKENINKLFSENRDESNKNIINYIESEADKIIHFIKDKTTFNHFIKVQIFITDEYYEEVETYEITYEGEYYPYTEQIPQQDLLFEYSTFRKL